MKRLMMLMAALAGLAGAESEVAGVLFSVGSTNEPVVALPLKKTDVRMDVTSGIVRTEVVQRFQNDLDRPLEAIYIFPLPSEAAVEDFEIRLKDRIIRSSVKERAAAKATYEKAKAEGRKAALLEQERPNIFTTSVANLLPGETVELVFSYVEQLKFRKDRFDLTFPMVVGARYIPFRFNEEGTREPAVADAGRLNPPVLHPNLDSGHRLSIQVELQGLPLETLTSSTHAIEVEARGEDAYSVTLAREVTVPNCEFSLALGLRKNESPAVSFVQSVSDEAYGLLSVFPPIGKKRIHKPLPKDAVFLIDTSGSMSGESMAQAQSGLKRCLQNLQPDDRFTVVRFSSDFSSFSPELRVASEDKIGAAQEYVAGMEANGGTEMQPALEHVLELLPQESGRMPLVIFLTDGDVGNEDSLINLLSKKLHNTRLFTFGIGSAPNEFLLHRMAESGRGQSRFIRSHEDVGEVMSDFFQTLEAPVLTDVQVEWEDGGVQTYPARCPDIFYGRPLQLVARSDLGFGGQVRIRGRLDGEEQSFGIDLSAHQDDRHEAIEKLYGRMQVKDLMVQLMQADGPDEQKLFKRSVVEVALRHQLVTAYTSRIAVEEQVVADAGDLVSVKVPVPVPRGWSMYATATHETVQLVAGLVLLLGAWLLRWRWRAA
ncbi:VIT domain-containing protein [Pontiellaceae bacterium B12227]|nr:VIT domain-containing protein [Pontiellaceae bacterium B12227]